MNTCSIHKLTQAKELVALAQRTNDPILVFDGDDECLIAMRPAVFEHILFDSDLLNCSKRETMRI